MYAEYEEIFSEIARLSETQFQTLLDGTTFTQEEVVEDMELFREEMIAASNVENASDLFLPEERVQNFLEQHPALAHVLYVMNIILLVLSGVQQLDDFVLPTAQNVIVTMQGNQDIFFVKVEQARIYAEPSSRSEVVYELLYGEQVECVESINLWLKIRYLDKEGNQMEGWIAKRNLMTYRDYQFNADFVFNLAGVNRPQNQSEFMEGNRCVCLCVSFS